MHHVACFVADLPAELQRYREQDVAIALEARTKTGVDFAMVDVSAALGHMLELYEPNEDLRRFYAHVRKCASKAGTVTVPCAGCAASQRRRTPMGRLEGKTAVVLGAAGRDNMGQVMARTFAREGARVMVAGRHEGPLREIATEIGGRYATCDITKKGRRRSAGECRASKRSARSTSP